MRDRLCRFFDRPISGLPICRFEKTRYQSDATINASVLYSLKGDLPGDTPGVTRYPHPESNNTLKSKAPASGVPARLRVFCLTPCSISLPNSASSSAPASPQGLAAWYGRLAYMSLDLQKRWREQPRPEVGRVRQSQQDRPWTGSIPARRGGTTIGKSRRAFDRRSQSSILSIVDFPVPENRRSQETQNVGPSRAENLWRGAPRRYPHVPLFACATIGYTGGRSRCGSIELLRSASPRQRHSQVATSATVCNRRLTRAVTAHDGTT